MNAAKFLKLDLKVMKAQIKTMFLYPLTGLIMIVFLNSEATFILGYMLFGFSVLATTPFSMDNAKSYSIFYYTLPAKTDSMVMGRFLLLFTGITSFGIMSVLLVLICIVKGGSVTGIHILYYTIFTSAMFIISCLQYTMFYKVGVIKSQQFFTFIQMIPGMIIWLIMSFGNKYISEAGNHIQSVLVYGSRHLILAVLLELLPVSLVFFTCCHVSAAICRKKELK
ncbi:ABC-2 transporter permease [Anaerocolumna sp. AGMB13025]|uniref:ABC-2 transporter permease n=1 Tax=Anaerocolumna sp. AGMB13025 TaxID=3039116 RepID=UPI00241F356B|nr:ABC-2 transporter permease [Anaerocolumna sp. AGMB13025]WFR59815.1 ABC-2 transporter permease [Anaerocolumna sp. AGMB13025]